MHNTAPSYRQNETYSGWTQDVIRLIHEAHQRGAASVSIEVERWRVTVTWPGHNSARRADAQ